MKQSLAAAALALGLVAGPALGQDRAQLELRLKDFQKAAKDLGDELAKHRASEKTSCKASDAADEILAGLSTSDGDFARTTDMATQAAKECEKAKATTREAEARHRDARGAMREAALLAAQCRTVDPKFCEQMAAPAVAKTDAAIPEVVARADAMAALAAEAQAAIDKLRGRAAKIYDAGDAATADALTLEYAKLGPQSPKDDAERQKVLERAKDSADQAMKLPVNARRAITEAQHEADRWVRAALAWKACANAGTCADGVQAEAQAAQFAMAARTAKAKDLLDALDKSKYTLAELAARPQSSTKDLDGAVEFRKLLDSNPDVKSYFGSDTVGLSAGTSGNTVSLRYTMENKQAFGRNRATLVVTSPTAGAGGGTLYDTADRFKNTASISLGYQSTTAGMRIPVIDVIQDWAVGVTLARDDRTYLVPGSPVAARYTEETRSYYNRGVNGSYVWLIDPKEGSRMAKLRFAWQRVRKDGDALTQCDYSQSSYVDPNDPAKTYNLIDTSNCVQGTKGAPTSGINRVVEFGFKQLRFYRNVDLALTITHTPRNAKDKHQTDVELPVYFWKYKNTDPEGDGLTGGLVANWTTAKSGLKWGLFVSTPLSFARPADR